jgi:hypothetical protein
MAVEEGWQRRFPIVPLTPRTAVTRDITPLIERTVHLFTT